MFQYKLLARVCEFALSKEVNGHLERGWKLYGNPSASVSVTRGVTDLIYAQAVIKEN